MSATLPVGIEMARDIATHPSPELAPDLRDRLRGMPPLPGPPRLLPALLAATLLHGLIGYTLLRHYQRPVPLTPPATTVVRATLVSLAPTPAPTPRPTPRPIPPASSARPLAKPAPPKARATLPPPPKPRPAKKPIAKPSTPRPAAKPVPKPPLAAPAAKKTRPLAPVRQTAPTPASTESAPTDSATATTSPPPATPGERPPALAARVVPPRFDVAYLRNPPPVYPLSARRRGDQGTVIVQAEISPDGRCLRAEVERSSGHPRLDRAALAAIRQWRFTPARRGEQAVSAWVAIPIHFRLNR